MKKLFKLLTAAILCVAMLLSLTACGGNQKNEAAAPAVVDTTYSVMKGSYIDGIGWYQTDTYELLLNTNGTYELIYTSTRFGAEDYDMRGLRTIVFTGTYTSAASADAEPSHLDVKLNAATQISWDQQGKGFTRVEVLPGNFYLNTAAWTDGMSTVSGTTAEEVLANYAKELSLTVENSALDPEDTTLSNRIVGVPDLGIAYGEG